MGGRLWKVVKRNNRSGINIFNWCSVKHYSSVASLSQPDHQGKLPICRNDLQSVSFISLIIDFIKYFYWNEDNVPFLFQLLIFIDSYNTYFS